MDAERKFVVFGLDNSGKTAIVHSLKGEGNLLSMCTFKPTVDYKIESVETGTGHYRIWDFGGQDKYRAKHLERIAENLAHASKIIYVIDLQDVDRFNESLAYLASIVEHVKDPVQELSVFLHKADPPVMGPVVDPWDAVAAELVPRIRVIVPPHVQLKIFKTSVYTVFHKVPVS